MKKLYITSYLLLVVLAFASINFASAQENCPENLYHYWTFNKNNGGNFEDQVGNLDATTMVSTETVEGMIDKAQYFNGLSELLIPDNTDFDWSANASFTFEFWVNKSTSCPAQNVSSNNVIIGRDDSNSNLHWWIGISCTNPGKVSFTLMSNDGIGHILESKRGIIDGNWHLVSVVRDGTLNSSSIFIDGQLDTTCTFTFSDNFASIVPVSVGWINLNHKYHLEAAIDELAYYMAAIDDSIFVTHFNSGIGKTYCERGTTKDATDTLSYQLTINFTGFSENVGKQMVIYLHEPESQQVIDSLIEQINVGDFVVVFDSLVCNNNYNVDFFTDLNGNGLYDIPPVDEAWRIEVTSVTVDTTIVFVYDTVYTNIGMIAVGIDNSAVEKGFSIYPNPARDKLYINLLREANEISIHGLSGSLLVKKSITHYEKLVHMDISALNPGLYIIRLRTETGFEQQKFLKE